MNNDVATHVRSVPTLLPWHQTSWELLLPLSFKDNIIIPHHGITYFCHFQFLKIFYVHMSEFDSSFKLSEQIPNFKFT